MLSDLDHERSLTALVFVRESQPGGDVAHVATHAGYQSAAGLVTPAGACALAVPREPGPARSSFHVDFHSGAEPGGGRARGSGHSRSPPARHGKDEPLTG